MPKKKSAREMTDDEIAHRLFPKKVIEVVKKLSGAPEKKPASDSPRR